MLGKEVINDKPLIGEAAQMVREEAKKVLEERNNEIKKRALDKFPKLMIPISGEGLCDMNEEYRELYMSVAHEQKEIDIDLVDKWLRKHLPRVISNYPLNENVVTDMLNEDMRADLRKYLRNQ